MEEQFSTCNAKQEQLVQEFLNYPSTFDKYERIIQRGRQLPPLASDKKTAENIVMGCQSILYLHSYLNNKKIYFEAESEALISSGLASLLIYAYSDEEPKTILKCPPLFLEKLAIHAALTPGRSNGLASMHLRMKQDALKFLIGK